MNSFIARVYAAGGTKNIDPTIIDATAKELKKGLKKGFKKTFKDFDANSPDFDMLANLENNVYQFAAAKNYQEMRLLTNALTNEAGEIISFTEFRDIAEKQFQQFNADWLDSEYSTSISASLNAARWTDYTRNANAMPYLRYSTVGDALVRDSHAAFDGTVKPIDHNFWANYYPPNGWRCRCGTTQTGNSRETPDGAIVYAEVPSLFRTNLAKQGLMFPKNHPYYTNVPHQVIREAMAYLPPENTYRTIKVNGVTIEEHALLQNNEKRVRDKNREIAAILKKNGSKSVKLLPEINAKDYNARVMHYGEKYAKANPKACPDAVINGQIVEFKTASPRYMSTRVGEAAQKANICVLQIDATLTDIQIDRFVNGQFNMKGRENLEQITIIRGQKPKTYIRQKRN
jgi:SPP1 gp7 family putative phage head morphogenesis protein